MGEIHPQSMDTSMNHSLVPFNEGTSKTPHNTQSSEILARLTAQYRSTFLPETPEHWGITLFKGSIYLIAINAGLPYVSPAMQFTSNVMLSYFFGASVYIAIGSVSVWSVRNYMTYLQLLDNTSTDNKSTEWAITIGSIAVGIISALPGALVTLKYNPLWMLPLSLFFDISTNTASLNQFFRKMYIDQYLYKGKEDIYKAREQLIEKLHYGLSDNIPVSTPTNQTILDEFNHAITIADPKLKKKNDLPLLSSQTLYFVKNLLGFLLPLSWEIICIYLVYSDMQIVLNLNSYLAGFIALTTTFPAFFLEYLFATAILTALYEVISNHIFGVQSTNPAFNANPQITITILAIALCLVAGAFTSRAQIILDLLPQSGLREALLYLVCIGTIIFKMSATSMNLLEIENNVAAQVSSNSIYNRKLLFNKFQMVLETSKPETVGSLLSLLDHPGAHEIDVESNAQPETSTLIHNDDWFSLFSQGRRRSTASNQFVTKQMNDVVYSSLQNDILPSNR